MEKANTETNSNKSDENNKMERVCIFIDGSNFYNNTAKKGINVNFERLIDQLTKDKELVNAFYYIASLDFDTNPKKYWSHQKFLNKLRKIPKFNVVLCKLKKITDKDQTIHFEVKGDDALLIHDLICGAYENIYDTAIIVSGDEDFAQIIKTIQNKGKKVGNAYFKKSSSQALRQVCDFSIPMDNLINKIIIQKEDSA